MIIRIAFIPLNTKHPLPVSMHKVIAASELNSKARLSWGLLTIERDGDKYYEDNENSVIE